MLHENAEQRLLILAPFGKDAPLIESMLHKERVACTQCRSVDELASEYDRGAAMLLIAEEAIAERNETLASLISHQPPWSDIPVLLLTRTGADSAVAARAIHTLGNVTLLERPVRVSALTSAVLSALKARRRQYETRAHLEELEQADQRKDQFLATLAHELRNPLAPIRNALSLLRLADAHHPTTIVSDIMERQVEHLARLIDDLIDVSRITRGKIELRTQIVDIAQVINAAVETSRPVIELGGHDLEVRLPAESLLLDADPVRLAQVFANLLNNAAKYTDPGGRIEVDARRKDARVIVSVADNGIGIGADALPRVFDMFAQADSSAGRTQGGLGIGLTLVRSLVEMHGGDVTAASPGPGRGSCFTVTLPLSRRVVPRPQPAPPPPSPVQLSHRILVVDDNRDAADTMGTLLEMLGADVRIAYDGPCALDIVDIFHPDVAILDLGMPGMTGYELAARIRERSDVGHCMLVALTGWSQDKDRKLTEAAGFDHHLIKPVDLEHIQQILASVPQPVE